MHAMHVDAGSDRPAKGKPVETTPQVTKKTRTKGEEVVETTNRKCSISKRKPPEHSDQHTQHQPQTNEGEKQGEKCRESMKDCTSISQCGSRGHRSS